MVFLRAGRAKTRPATSADEPLPTYNPWQTSRHRLQQHVVTALRIDPTLAHLIIGTDAAPPPTPTSSTQEPPSSERLFLNGVNRASASYALSALRSGSISSQARSTASLRNFISRHSSKSQPLRQTVDEVTANDENINLDTNHIQLDSNKGSKRHYHSHRGRHYPHQRQPQEDIYSSSSSLNMINSIPMQPMPESSLPLLLTAEETILPPQLPTTSGRIKGPTKMSTTPSGSGAIDLSKSGRLRATFTHGSRHSQSNLHVHPKLSPPSVNPFTTAFISAPPCTFDVMNHITLDSLPAVLDIIRASILLPFSAVPPRHHAHFISLIHGIRPPSTPFIFEPNSARIWQEDTTWRKEVRGTKPICSPQFPLDSARKARARGHPNWPLFVGATLGRMLAVTAGLQQRGHECLRSIVALQSIREMLRLRSTMRAALRRAAQEAPTAVTLPKFGTLAVTQDGWLALDGSARADPAFLDMTAWRSENDVAKGLVAWTNAEVDVAVNICEGLKSTRLTIRAAPYWCRLALQTCAARDVDCAMAVVGIIRFLFLQRWIPEGVGTVGNLDGLSPDYSHSVNRIKTGGRDHRVVGAGNICESDPSVEQSIDEQKLSAYRDLLCANEFIDRAVAITDLETCLTEVLGISKSFARGHDIDCGALTTGEILEVAQLGGTIPARRGRRSKTTMMMMSTTTTTASNKSIYDGEYDDKSWSSWTLRNIRRRRVVMSLWTDALEGNEWCVPQGIPTFVDFRNTNGKYRLSVAKGDIRCKRLGTWRSRRKHRMESFDGLEANGAVALCNALDRMYGDVVCFHVLAWMQRGIIRLHDTCAAAAFIPRRSLGGNLIVNRRLPFQICRKMIFARKGHQLFWLPGEDLPPFRITDCPNGTYHLTEEQRLPIGVELCRAEIAKDFG